MWVRVYLQAVARQSVPVRDALDENLHHACNQGAARRRESVRHSTCGAGRGVLGAQ